LKVANGGITVSTYNDIDVGKVISTLKVIIDRVYVIGDGEERKVNVFLKGEDFEYAEPM
jgi:hypothetical protein